MPNTTEPTTTAPRPYYPTVAKEIEIKRDFAQVINRHSLENGSNTPDMILAQYLWDCLQAYNAASRIRERWYGRALTIREQRPAWLDDEEKAGQ